MARIDHCSNIIHFTRGKNNPLDYEEAYLSFKRIIKYKTLNSGNGMILGKHKCICFTEIPAKCLTINGTLDKKYFSRYTPFGFQLTKKDIYNLNGRPVIYSHRDEYNLEENNPNLNWRFVTYDPNKEGRSDFTWEREWRIKNDCIKLDNEKVKLVFPNMGWINRFITEHEKEYHNLSLDDDCEKCYCTRDATILKIKDILEDESCEISSGTCTNPDKFPWILIDMNEKETICH
ncbi:hypothetical protein [Flavobacterium sp. ZB4R12]|uniref:hypothetical protein n=1 Tax=Flavobacterium sp. ZB4R12 TaxID=3398732 RepID=UPI003AAAC8AE